MDTSQMMDKGTLILGMHTFFLLIFYKMLFFYNINVDAVSFAVEISCLGLLQKDFPSKR